MSFYICSGGYSNGYYICTHCLRTGFTYINVSEVIMQRNFYRMAWAHEVMLHSDMTKKEALAYVDERMNEYYMEHIKESDD